MRYFFEQATKVLTGSDKQQKHAFCKDFSSNEFLGDGLIDEKVWIVNSYFPYYKQDRRVPMHKCVLLVRDPIDCLFACYNHFNSPLESSRKPRLSEILREKEDLDEFLLSEIENWVKFNDYWMSPDREVPVYVVKYEDLLKDSRSVLKTLLCFLLN